MKKAEVPANIPAQVEFLTDITTHASSAGAGEHPQAQAGCDESILLSFSHRPSPAGHHDEDTIEGYSHSSQPSSEPQASQTGLPLGQPEISSLDEPGPESQAPESNMSQELNGLRKAFEFFKGIAARDLNCP